MAKEAFDLLLYAWIALAILLAPVQILITPPYGRHRAEGWGPQIDNRLGWIVMEMVSPIVFAVSFLHGDAPVPGVVWVFCVLWVGHYLHRSLIYPFRIRTPHKRIPFLIVVAGIAFNGFNGWSNGFYLGSGWGAYSDAWVRDPRFVVGLAVFVAGAAINLWSDNRLLGLRGDDETGYAIPRGGLYERVSCPNYLGEIVEWTGFAVLCWNLPAAAFAVWTAANLGPRALSHHRWYRKRFPDYPPQRKALVPYIL